MVSLVAQKEFRRKRLAELMKEVGPARLAEITGIAEAYLYQMSGGKAQSKRSVSDATVAKIEQRAGRAGWFEMTEVPRKATRSDSLLSGEARALIALITAADQTQTVDSSSWKDLAGVVRRMMISNAPAAKVPKGLRKS